MNKTAVKGVDLATLLHAASAAQEEVEARLSGLGLSLAKLAALKVLSDAGGSLPLTQLAERLACVKSNITQLVDRLEADGFVRRQFDPKDRRSRLATLTADGRTVCREGSRVQEVAEQKLMGKLSAAESQQLAQLLARITSG